MWSFRYRHTNCFVVPNDRGEFLAVDAGWPETWLEYARGLKGIGLAMKDLKWAMVTHFHMDHAGLIGEFQAQGLTCIVFEIQGEGIDAMETTIRKTYGHYRPIDQAALKRVGIAEAPAFFDSLGIAGRVLATPGHSDDSVSFLDASGQAIIGDLTPLAQVLPEDSLANASYNLLRANGVRQVFPSHAPPFII